MVTCPKCNSTRVSGKYYPKHTTYCPHQQCFDCGARFTVDAFTGNEIVREKRGQSAKKGTR